MNKNEDKTATEERKYSYQVIRVTYLPEDTPREKILKEISLDDLSEARQIAVNVLHEEMDWLVGKYSVKCEYEYDEEKGVGYAIVMMFVDSNKPQYKNKVEGSYNERHFEYGRKEEMSAFQRLGLEYSYDVEEMYRNRNMRDYKWHYQVEMNENGQTIQVDFKAENGYQAGFEAKNFCLGRKLFQEGKDDASIDLFMVGISPYYKKPWKKSLLNEKLLINVRMWEDDVFYQECDLLPDNLSEREKNIMSILREKDEEEW